MTTTFTDLGITVSGKHNPAMPPAFWYRFNAAGIFHYYVNGKWITRRVAAILMAEGVAVERRMWRGESYLPKRKGV